MDPRYAPGCFVLASDATIVAAAKVAIIVAIIVAPCIVVIMYRANTCLTTE